MFLSSLQRSTSRTGKDRSSEANRVEQIQSPSVFPSFPATTVVAMSTQRVNAASGHGAELNEDLLPSSSSPTAIFTAAAPFVEARANGPKSAKEEEGGGEWRRWGPSDVQQQQQPVAFEWIEASFSSFDGDTTTTATATAADAVGRRNTIDSVLLAPTTVNIALSSVTHTSATDAPSQASLTRGGVVLKSEGGGKGATTTPHLPPLSSDSVVVVVVDSASQLPTVQSNVTSITASSSSSSYEVSPAVNGASSESADEFLTTFAVSEATATAATGAAGGTATADASSEQNGVPATAATVSFTAETLLNSGSDFTVTNRLSSADMADTSNVSSSTPFLDTTDGDTAGVSPSPTPTQPPPTASSNFSTLQPSSGNSSLPLGAVTTTPRSSGSRGGDSTFNSSSSASSSSSPIVEGSGDSSGDLGGGGGGRATSETERDLTSATLLISPCNGTSTLSSASGNCSDVGGRQGDSGDVPVLLVALPVSVFLLLVFALVMSFFCIRRKKKKRVHKSSQEDLWLAPPTSPRQVPSVSLTLPPPVVCINNNNNNNNNNSSGSNSLPALPVSSSGSALFPSSLLTADASQSLTGQRGEDEGGDNEEDEEGEGVWNPHNPKPRVSSFLIRKKQGTNICLREHNSFSLGKITASQTVTPGVTRSASTLIAVPPVRLSPSPSSLRADDVKDKYFKALFAYKAAYRGELTLREGEIIQAREKDQNGWLLGRKLHSKEEGWVPAVYVDEMTGDVSLVEKSKGEEEGERQGRNKVDHEVYGVLAANRTKSPDQSWIGIEHRVSQAYAAKEGEESLMSLRVGDTVTVVEALDCGWWLGYHGDQVGWFPGDHVELLEEKIDLDLDAIPLPLHTSPHHAHITNNHLDVSPGSKRSSVASSVDSRELQDRKSLQTLSRESMLAEGAEKPRPARRAPAPPSDMEGKHPQSEGGAGMSGMNTLSRNLRPKRPAPAPPVHKPPRCQSMGSVDRVSKLGVLGDGKGQNSGTSTPRRLRKPKVVRVPKERLGLDKISSCPVPSFPPPAVVSSPSISSSADESHTTTVSSASVTSSTDECHTVDSQSLSSSAKDSDSVSGGSKVCEQKESGEAAVQSDSENLSTEGMTAASPSLTVVSSGQTSENSSGRDIDARDTDTEDDVSDSGDSSQETLGPESGITSEEKASPDAAAAADSSLSADIFQALSGGDMILLPIPGVSDSDSGSVQLDSPRQPSPEPSVNSTPVVSSPESAALEVKDSPTLQAPSLVISADSGDGSAEAAPTSFEHLPPEQSLDTFPAPEAVQQVVMAEKGADIGDSDSKTRNRGSDTENRHSTSSLLESFQSPLTVDVRASSPIPTVKYLPPPSVLLDDAEESPVDDLQPSGQSSPASSETSSRSSSSSKPTGYWKFHSGSNGHSPRPRSTKLTKVAPPVVPKPVKDSEEAVVAVPPAGTSGRVHKIVHQINRMTSFEEPASNLHRKPSLNQPPTASPGEVPEEESSEPQPQQTKDVQEHGEDVESTDHHHTPAPLLTQDSDKDIVCAVTLPESFPNGKLLGSSCSEKTSTSDNHDSESHSGQDSQSRSEESHHGNLLSVADTQEHRSRSQSREGTPESEGEGEERRQSSKKTRAPLPPKSPPFSALRKLHGLSVAEPESSEC